MAGMSASSAAANATTVTKPKSKSKAKSKYQALNLDKYLPLGTVKYEPTASSCGSTSIPVEVDNKPSTYFADAQVLGKHLDTLYLNGWIRVFVMQVLGGLKAAMRVYLLPDDIGRGAIPREDKKVRASLKLVMDLIDRSTESWIGTAAQASISNQYKPVCNEQDSLFYIFNTLQPPKPDPTGVISDRASFAMEDILNDSKEYLGLKTHLYDYQKRSAAMMIQREAQPTLQLDSRLEELRGPTGQIFYFDRVACQILSEKRLYEETRGGILAETMGHGKTLISLAVVLATKGHLPLVPLEYQTEFKPSRVDENRIGAASLKSIITRAIYQHAVPWKPFFYDLAREGEHPENCRNFIMQNPSWYSIPRVERQRRASYIMTEEKRIYLSSITLVVVPPNLMAHWQQEIDTHIEKDILSMKVFQDNDEALPDALELMNLDLILMSKTRFEDEMSPRKYNLAGKRGKSGSRHSTSFYSCSCSQRRRACPVHEYDSSLLGIHFLRFIVDEGHNFASDSGTRATVGLRSIHVERKWIISGTPSKGLLGLEIDMATNEGAEDHSKSSFQQQQDILAKRKARPSAELEAKDLAALGHAVTNFLGLQPWANSRSQEDSASWSTYLVPDATGARKAGNLRSVLESLVVRHQINQVEKDLELPTLSNKVVYLEPSYGDKISQNLFNFVLASNAVTSERTDQDYMFHPKNKPQLDALIKNLRHSGFHWAGNSIKDVSEHIRIGQTHLEKPNLVVPEDDKLLLEKAVEMGQRAVTTMSWKAYANTKELGLYVKGFPTAYKDTWALCEKSNRSPLLMGATYLVEAQAKVNSNIYASDPFKSLAQREGPEPWRSNAVPIGQQSSQPSLSLSPPTDSYSPDPAVSKVEPNSSFGSTQKLSMKDFNMHKSAKKTFEPDAAAKDHYRKDVNGEPSLKSAIKSSSRREVPLPDAYCDVSKVWLVGTSCAKLSYLIDRIVDLYEEEKVLIFYEGDHIAYYVAQALELLQIEHLIYATGLRVEMRSKYLEKFNKGHAVRVMLMDLKQAAHGLHVASASRVFFINPVWNPSIEAQAIKRAHRIGQTRPVHVETLVLKGTIEDKMFQRRKAMTSQEHQMASRSLLDDMTMIDILKEPVFHLVFPDEVKNSKDQLAPLKKPQQVFGREFRHRKPSEEELRNFETANIVTYERSRSESESEAHSGHVARKRKSIFADEIDRNRRPKSPRLEMKVQAAEPVQPAKTATSVAPTTPQKRKAMFADELPTSKALRLDDEDGDAPSTQRGRADRFERASTPTKSRSKSPRDVLSEAEAITTKWKKTLSEGGRSQNTPEMVAFSGIPSPGPSSGDESRRSAESPRTSKKRKVDGGDANVARAKTIKFTI